MGKTNNHETIWRIRNKIIDEYYSIYNDVKVAKPSELDNTEDISIDFINCTIWLAKKYLLENKLGSDYILVQPCLRNNQIDILLDDNLKSNYMSYFTMIGGFYYITFNDNYVDKFNFVVKKQFTLFRNLYNENKIKLTIPFQYRHLVPISDETIKYLKANNCEIYYSVDDYENLKWKYGIKDIFGYGTRWEILNDNGIYVNCGNDILLYRNNEAIGIDFGSGLETLISVYNCEEHLLYSNIICTDYIKNFAGHNKYNEKLIDAIISLLCVLHFKKNHLCRIEYIKSQYIKVISSVCIINNINIEFLKSLINIIEKNLNIGNKYESEIIRLINLHIEHLYNIRNSPKINKLIINYSDNKAILKNKLHKYKHNISSLEIKAIKSL